MFSPSTHLRSDGNTPAAPSPLLRSQRINPFSSSSGPVPFLLVILFAATVRQRTPPPIPVPEPSPCLCRLFSPVASRLPTPPELAQPRCLPPKLSTPPAIILYTSRPPPPLCFFLASFASPVAALAWSGDPLGLGLLSSFAGKEALDCSDGLFLQCVGFILPELASLVCLESYFCPTG